MEKLKLPFNVKEMDDKEKEEFIKRINNGDIELLLEVRDHMANLKGFQTVLSFEKWRELVTKKLECLAYINDKYQKYNIFIIKFMIKQLKDSIETTVKRVKSAQGVKRFMIDDVDDIESEFNNLGSYIDGETTLSYPICGVTRQKNI